MLPEWKHFFNSAIRFLILQSGWICINKWAIMCIETIWDMEIERELT